MGRTAEEIVAGLRARLKPKEPKAEERGRRQIAERQAREFQRQSLAVTPYQRTLDWWVEEQRSQQTQDRARRRELDPCGMGIYGIDGVDDD